MWLERALDRPYSAQLVRRWVLADGDLKPLRSDVDEFTKFLNRVPEVKFDEADSAASKAD